MSESITGTSVPLPSLAARRSAESVADSGSEICEKWPYHMYLVNFLLSQFGQRHIESMML